MTVFYDIQGSRFTRGVTGGSSYSRRFYSDNLTGANPLQLISAGLATLPASGAVLDGALFPTLFLVQAIIERVECDKDNVGQGVIYGSLEYEEVDQTQAQNPEPDDDGTPVTTSGSSLEQIQSFTDIFGNAITINPPASQAGAEAQSPSVTYDAPSSIRTFRRLESSNPQVRADTFVGTVNATNWTVSGQTTIAPGFAKCNRIQGTTRNGGASYDVIYEFAIIPPTRPGGWQPQIAWIDPETGQADPSSTVGDGISNVQVYPLAEFNDLNL